MTFPAQDIASPAQEAHRGSDVAVAARNAIKLGSSLIFTWGIALAVRFQLPRHLGPERFGDYNFCDSIAGAFFVFATLGVEMYIQKEVSVRPKHISDFFGGVQVARVFVAGLLVAGMMFVMGASERSSNLRGVAAMFAVAYFLMTVNLSLSSTLQAATKVGALSFVNVASKVVWGAGLAVGIWLDAPLVLLVLPTILSELLRTVVLYRAAAAHSDLRWKVDLAQTRAVLLTSIPFFINGVAVTLGTKLDVTMLKYQAADAEVGWYGAATNLAGLSMLLSPLVTWVLVPLLSRALQRSQDEFDSILRRANEGILIGVIPVTLMMALGADFLIRLAFGARYAPAAHTLRVIAPIFVLTYLATMLAMTLILLGRSWRLTTISLIGIAVQPVLSVLLVPITSRLGTGFAGAGAALALIGQEFIVTGLMLASIGKGAIDRRFAISMLKSLGTCAAVILLHRMLTGMGPWRLGVDLFAYVAIALLIRTVRVDEVMAFVAMIRQRRTA